MKSIYKGRGTQFYRLALWDSDPIIHNRLYRLRKRSSRQTLVRSEFPTILYNLIPSHNPLILRRRILKEKDNPATRGCGGRKCLSGFLLFHPMKKKDTLSKNIFYIKRNQNGQKIANQLWILFTPHLATSSTVSF